MNLVKAADDLKNLSDQQLMSAGQNPVAVPPYLVLAEMKRREQLRAEYAKAQQGQQQQQPPVAQQVAQNLMQGQQQPQQQQQPPAQGIMQAMPQGAVGMAGGGHVARYADGDLVTDVGAFKQRYGSAARQPGELSPVVEQMFGRPDYSQYEQFLRQQMEEARAKKVRIGDALIAAGAAMASNRDPRVGLASILAQGIGAGSQSYRQAQEQKKKDMETAMLAQMSLQKMKQQDQERKASAMMDLMRMDSGQLQTIATTLEANARSMYESAARERDANRRMQFEIEGRKAEQAWRSTESILDRKLKQEEGAKDRAAQIAIAGTRASLYGARASDPRVMQLNALKAQEVSLNDTLKSLMEQKKSIPLGRRGDTERASINEQIKNATAQLSKIQAPLASLSGIKVVDLPGEHD